MLYAKSIYKSSLYPVNMDLINVFLDTIFTFQCHTLPFMLMLYNASKSNLKFQYDGEIKGSKRKTTRFQRIEKFLQYILLNK